MNFWQMPDEICIGLKHQLNPNYDGKYHAFANLIYLAKAHLKKRGIGNASSAYVPDALYDRLGLEEEKVNEIIDKVIESSEDLKKHGYCVNTINNAIYSSAENAFIKSY